MRTAFKDEEEEELAEAGHSPAYDYDQPTGRELSLSSTTLLAIFFGLVLVCGLCFGLGYTLGRRSSSDAVDNPSTVQAASSVPINSQPKPSAASPYKPAQPEAEIQPATPQATDNTTDDVQPESAPVAVKPAVASPIPAPVTSSAPTVKPALQPVSTDTTPSPKASPGIMVQIAAVSNPADAAVLVSALQKHGYSAITRREAADTLTHVQVGPFASRAEANAMRQKLQADGYNAFLK